ncbi:HEAT repeat-containing protein 1 [Manduca sexta]|uniref:HEAT repeat-containing protein 1 n=1 Tax=Manduca sexta TaxID=7130 RepID=UPI00118257E1|nr:HEAT repeat-containing protein 1 [Manduca sexta]
MASTSLAQQLQKLSAPQTKVYKDTKKQISLLFDPSEAALKDRDTFYEIGVSGLNELIALNPDFAVYQDTLFSLSSKDFERAVQSKEVNQNLDQTIEKFLLQISPYFLLQSSHKAIEWLINRYHIQQYNQDAIMALILPYHGTLIFVRFIQLLEIKHNRWNWLAPIQKNGIPLASQVLHNQCVSNASTLSFIAKMVVKYVKEYKEKATQLNTVFAFFCQVAIGVIDTSKKFAEASITALLPTLMKGIESTIVDFRSSCYIVLGYLFTKTNIKRDTLNQILDKLLTTEFDLSYDVVLLITMMYEHQAHLNRMSDPIFNISVDMMNTICKYLKKFVEVRINIQPFVLAFLREILPHIQSNIGEFKAFSPLPEILINEVDLKNQGPEKIIKCILDAYCPNKEDNSANDSESDIEIIDEDGFSSKILNWYAILLKNFERQYPDAFDKVITAEMSSANEISPKRKGQLSKLLGFKPAIAHKVGGTYLFENLNHVNPDLRIEAVKYIGKEFEALKIQNADFVKESILDRLRDDDPKVVNAALDIEDECLEEVLNEIDLTNAFVNIVSKRTKKWRSTIKRAIIKFCSLDILSVNQDTILVIMPLLFPEDEKTVEVANHIIKSKWGQKFNLTKRLSKKLGKSQNSDELRSNLFKELFIAKSVNFDDLLDENLLDKSNTLDISFYILLKSCSFNKATVEGISSVLNLLLESVENRLIVQHSEDGTFSEAIMPKFIKLAAENKMLFEVIEYIFCRVIEDMNVKDIAKPWCNVLETPETVLIRRLYEICITGCAIPSYGENYVKLLQKLLNKFCSNPKEKFEFIANFACGHILYATDPKDVIAPELQLRSLKLLTNFLAVQENANWIFDSDVVMLVILFNLNNPLIVIRESAIDIMNKILREEPDKKLVYIQLINELNAHRKELILDHDQISQVLHTILTAKDIQNKLFRRNCLLKFTGILNENIPSHIKAGFLKLLYKLDNANTFPNVISCLNPLEKILSGNILNAKFTFDVYESNMFRSIYSLINESTITTFNKEQVWKSIEVGLKEYRLCISEEDQSYTSPSILIMRQINENVFMKIPEENRKDLVYLIASAGAVSNNPTISLVASKVMKNIQLSFADFKPILEGMLNAEDPAANVPKKKKTTVSMLSYQLMETDEWRLGVALLEHVQSKKKMKIDNSFVSILFQLLNKCLRFEEQSYVEYTKQLILSSLWYYCKKYVDDKDNEQLKSLRSVFDVELIVQCIRGTQNPQTHHHALILLSHAAYMLPDQVLHHTMEIFTFMGSSVLRHDDAYSFQIITKIIENLIPILVKMDKSIEDHTEKELKQLQTRVVPVLRIFADVVLHVPEHRRLPLFKKLIETLGPSQFLWVFLALLLETHIAHFNETKKNDSTRTRTLAGQESPVDRLDFGQSILLEFPPEVGMENFVKLIMYIKSLPLQKDENSMETDVNPSDIFSVNGHTPVQLRHYKYVIITFMNTCLASSRFIHLCSLATDTKTMESHFKTLIVNVLSFIQVISKVTDEKTAKYWRVMLHHSYDLLDNANNLLSPTMFLSVVKGLLKHTLQTVRRKAMELLNSKIQTTPETFEDVDRELLYSLLPALLDIIKTIENKDETWTEIAAQELELNQQTALLSLKLLTRMLAAENPEPFKDVLGTITNYTCNLNISGNVMASIVLCLAELCSNLKAHALASLRRFMPALIKVLKKQRKAETPELVLLSTVTAIAKIVESLPLFLSPYLQKILYEYSILFAKWQQCDQKCSKVTAIVAKLANIRKKIAESIPPRVLIPVANETHQLLLEKENFDAIGPVMSVLADSFANVTTADFTALQHDLTAFFLTALQLRSDAAEKNIDNLVIDKAEDEVVNALVCLVLKLSETSFRPLYFKIYDWAIRTNVEGYKDRAITFYRLSSAIADRLKGLFVLFAGHFVKNAAELLDACNNSKTEDLYFDNEEKCINLVKYIIKTLHIVFLYDSQSFLNKSRFETLMQPVVDQLENTLGGVGELKGRAAEYLIPCVSQFAVATADDSLWKLLNYQILLKTRHNDAEIRLTALDCLVAMATHLGSSWLPLLAESVPFLAELLEDGDQKIETATKDAIRKLEQILGEPLEKYF